MKYFQYITLDNIELIKDKILKFISPIENIPLGLSFINKDLALIICPELADSVRQYDLEIENLALYTVRIDGPIHIDYKSEKHNKCRINIPLLNCQGSTTEFFSGGDYNRTFQPNKLSYYTNVINENVAVKVTEVEINQPTILNIQEPHRVITNKTLIGPRITLSIFTDKDPIFLIK
jgi:hypothetical protein